MAKAMILGADLCGIASPFIQPAKESVEAVVALIERFKREYKTALFLLGAKNTAYIKANKSLILK